MLSTCSPTAYKAEVGGWPGKYGETCVFSGNKKKKTEAWCCILILSNLGYIARPYLNKEQHRKDLGDEASLRYIASQLGLHEPVVFRRKNRSMYSL